MRRRTQTGQWLSAAPARSLQMAGSDVMGSTSVEGVDGGTEASQRTIFPLLRKILCRCVLRYRPVTKATWVSQGGVMNAAQCGRFLAISQIGPSPLLVWTSTTAPTPPGTAPYHILETNSWRETNYGPTFRQPGVSASTFSQVRHAICVLAAIPCGSPRSNASAHRSRAI